VEIALLSVSRAETERLLAAPKCSWIVYNEVEYLPCEAEFTVSRCGPCASPKPIALLLLPLFALIGAAYAEVPPAATVDDAVLVVLRLNVTAGAVSILRFTDSTTRCTNASWNTAKSR